jgi:uncharacterized protein YbjT (DUF2867 family)
VRVLVTGCTGYVGGRLVPRLIAEGHHVICVARDVDRLDGRGWKAAELRKGDVLDYASLPAAMQDVDVAYYLVHSMADGAEGFAERDELGARNFGTAAREAGVKRIVYLGGLGGSESRLSTHLASRQRVGDVLRASGVPVTEFRAAVIIGSGSISFEMIRYLVERLPVMVTPRWVVVRCQPIAIDDVLEYLTRCLQQPRSIGLTLEIGGPDVLTYGDMMRRYAAARGLKRLLFPVPVLTPRLSSYWVDLVTPIPASYSHPLIEGLRNEVIVRDSTARGLFDFEPMPFESALSRALDLDLSGEIETYRAQSHGALPPGRRPPAAEGSLVAQHRLLSTASPEAIFSVFTGIGGKRGWYYADWIWRLRGLLDRLVGGVGMRRGRRSLDELRAGDVLDFWRVEAVEAGRLLRLRAEMKLPGSAWLQFEVEPRAAGGTEMVQTAFFQPRGLAGLAYWYGLAPVHKIIFSGLVRAIVQRAEARDRQGSAEAPSRA